MTGNSYWNLPGANSFRHLSVRIEEGEAELDDLQQVHVTPQQLGGGGVGGRGRGGNRFKKVLMLGEVQEWRSKARVTETWK